MPVVENDINMEDVMATLPTEDKQLRKGELVEGEVVQVNKDEILINLTNYSLKSEARMPLDQFTSESVSSFEDLPEEDRPKVGDIIKARVIVPSGKDGMILSKKSADYDLRWDEIKEIYEEGRVVKAVAKEAVKGGLVVDFLGYSAFCPASQVAGKYENFAKHAGEDMEFKIIEIDKSKRRIILSNIKVVNERKQAAKRAFWDNIQVGEEREGIVKSVLPYGVFVDIGGFEGMLHISEMSWNRISEPSKMFKAGDSVRVVILSFDEAKQRVSLGHKQLLPDPWRYVKENIVEGTEFTGKITRIVAKAAFMDMGNGFEGLIPISEMANERIDTPDKVLKEGEEKTVLVKQVIDKDRKVILSIKALLPAPERRSKNHGFTSEQSYDKDFAPAGHEEGGASTSIGDLYGDLFKNTEDKEDNE
ncbi:MAG: S1 RNA-binding domain-containing protein [Abditibacteriota bacterium]|nr:S1 RNA-binding domain-containing protein [Abditibacteriota bacterium]